MTEREDAERMLTEIGKMIRASMPSGMGFVLMMTAFDDPAGMAFYTSNCDRRDICVLMRKFLQRHEPN